MKKILLLPALASCAVAILFFGACYKTDINAGTDSTNSNHIPPDQTVIASLKGRVIDENGVPMEGASVVSGGVTTTTDVNGLFSFANINLSSRWGYVRVSKTGYFTGSRSIITNGAASNYVNIQMIPRSETGSFAATAGGVIVIQAGDSAAFGANTVVNATTNAAYTGTVHVFMKYLDPTDPNLYKYMPGDLRGIGSDGNETALQSFGMVLVELQGDAGERLQMMNAQTATLTWAIPSGLQSVAPATIPLWYFNDTTGRWIQQGSAVRNGNSFVGKVSHFTFWNCDAPVGTVNFKVRFKDQHGNPLAYTFIYFQSQTMGTRGGYTDSSGWAQGLIPKGQTLVLNVSTECGTILGGANVGPALTDQDLGTVIVNITNAELVLSGTVVDCSNNPVDSGVVTAQVDGLNYAAAVRNGAFVLPIHRCYNATAPVRLVAVDLNPAQTGSPVTIEAGTDSVNVGQLSACGNPVRQYIYFTINGVSYNFINPPDSVYYLPPSGSTMTGVANDGSNNQLELYFNSLTGVGAYSGYFSLTAPASGLHLNGGDQLQLNVSKFDPVNGYITGTFSGSATDSVAQKIYPVSGSVHVIRTH